jgi:hypothetical protein
MTCLCNPYAELDAPRSPNCPIHGELSRCDREIAQIEQEAHAGNPDVRGMLQGLHDWRTERNLIKASTRTSHPNGSDEPEFNTTTIPHGENFNG